MSKPLPTQNTFASLPPPWSLLNLDTNLTNVWAAINDIGTYGNVMSDTGAVNALVATPPAGITFALAIGISFDVIVANTNTSTVVTLNVNATGAKTVLDNAGNGPNVGSMQISGVYRFIWDGSFYRLQNPTSHFSGTWTSALTGPWTSGPNCTFKWTRDGTQCCIWTEANATATANTVANIVATGVPNIINPSVSRTLRCSSLQNNGTSGYSGVVGVSGNTLQISLEQVSGSLILGTANFTGSGFTGILASWSISYSV